jgi:hypothetical protein
LFIVTNYVIHELNIHHVRKPTIINTKKNSCEKCAVIMGIQWMDGALVGQEEYTSSLYLSSSHLGWWRACFWVFLLRKEGLLGYGGTSSNPPQAVAAAPPPTCMDQINSP